MLLELISLLKEYSGIDYRVKETKTYGPERYYVKKQLEMSRVVDTVHIGLTVYKEFTDNGKKYLGSSSAEIHPTSSKEEMKRIVDDAVYASGFVKNEYYELYSPDSEVLNEQQPCEQPCDLFEILDDLKTAAYSNDVHANGYLSYFEFFVKRNNIRIITSRGVDVTYTTNNIYMETAVTWKENIEIEVYEMYNMSNRDTKLLSCQIKKLFEVASKKPSAKPTPALKDINVLLSGECLKELFGYYYYNANASYIYNNRSTFEVGDNLQGDEVTGDKISICLNPFLEGSTESRAYDNDAFPLKEVELIKDGKLLSYYGDVRYSRYLGIPVTGMIDNYVVTGGTMPISEMKKQPYLEFVSFSDFQMETVTGDFSSEIRLGFYFDGEKTIPITGGSVSGNIKDIQSDMRISVERSQYNNYSGPSTICIKNVAIAGGTQ